jgi:hypothetical protein
MHVTYATPDTPTLYHYVADCLVMCEPWILDMPFMAADWLLMYVPEVAEA